MVYVKKIMHEDLTTGWQNNSHKVLMKTRNKKVSREYFIEGFPRISNLLCQYLCNELQNLLTRNNNISCFDHMLFIRVLFTVMDIFYLNVPITF